MPGQLQDAGKEPYERCSGALDFMDQQFSSLKAAFRLEIMQGYLQREFSSEERATERKVSCYTSVIDIEKAFQFYVDSDWPYLADTPAEGTSSRLRAAHQKIWR